MQFTKAQERRRSRRIRIGQPLKIRPSDPKDPHFDDTGTTKNVSREGIYFVSAINSYRAGMRLFVAVPHHSPREPLDHEYLGQVARVDALGEGQWGIAVQFLSDWKAE
jgi:hypothetical protein